MGVSLPIFPLWNFDDSGKYQARIAHQVKEGFYLNRAVVYIDDTVIYGKTKQVFILYDISGILGAHLWRTWCAFKWQEKAGNSRYSYPYIGFGHTQLRGNGNLLSRLHSKLILISWTTYWSDLTMNKNICENDFEMTEKAFQSSKLSKIRWLIIRPESWWTHTIHSFCMQMRLLRT